MVLHSLLVHIGCLDLEGLGHSNRGLTRIERSKAVVAEIMLLLFY